MRRVAFFCCLVAMLVLDVHGKDRQLDNVTVYVSPSPDLSGYRLIDSFTSQLRMLNNVAVLPTPSGAQFIIHVSAITSVQNRRTLDRVLTGNIATMLGVTVVSRNSGKVVFSGFADMQTSGLLASATSPDKSSAAASSIMKQLRKKLGWK